jgi:hypothetical protein
VNWICLAQNCCEHSNVPCGFVNRGKFRGWLFASQEEYWSMQLFYLAYKLCRDIHLFNI